jgi:hypothetical protein
MKERKRKGGYGNRSRNSNRPFWEAPFRPREYLAGEAGELEYEK